MGRRGERVPGMFGDADMSGAGSWKVGRIEYVLGTWQARNGISRAFFEKARHCSATPPQGCGSTLTKSAPAAGPKTCSLAVPSRARQVIERHNAVGRRRDRQESGKYAIETAVDVPDAFLPAAWLRCDSARNDSSWNPDDEFS